MHERWIDVCARVLFFQLNVEFLLLHGAALQLLLLVDVEADPFPGIDAEPLLEHLPDAKDRVGLGGVGQPDRQLVTFCADIHHSTVHLRL
jgi:hypothetical protein